MLTATVRREPLDTHPLQGQTLVKLLPQFAIDIGGDWGMGRPDRPGRAAPQL
jgi:hypothetical protein